MTEYIDRNALLQKIRWASSAEEAVISARRMPAADVSRVRHGRWVEQEKYTFGTMYDCSICGDRILDTGHSWNYCPNCGAKMDGGAD